MLIIVIFALVLRLLFFIGYTSNPAYEGIHLSTARMIHNGEFNNYLSRYREMPENYIASTAETHPVRLLMNYPVAFFGILG